jgi:hypothetical protein
MIEDYFEFTAIVNTLDDVNIKLARDTTNRFPTQEQNEMSSLFARTCLLRVTLKLWPSDKRKTENQNTTKIDFAWCHIENSDDNKEGNLGPWTVAVNV